MTENTTYRDLTATTCSPTQMTDQQLYELGQLYSELFLIRRLIHEGAGIRQRLLTHSECERIEEIAALANTAISGVMRMIDSHKLRAT